jgi:hypothetical protein
VSGRPSKLTLLRPGWLLLHAVTLAVCGGMLWLGFWQWRAAVQRGDDLRNYAYALQWWAFVGFTVLMWFRIVHDHPRPNRRDPAPDADTPDVGAPAAGAPAAGAPDDGAQDAPSPVIGTPSARAQRSGVPGAGSRPGSGPEAVQPPAAPADRYVGYTPPPPPDPELETDPERRRLNAYLARLSAADREAAE